MQSTFKQIRFNKKSSEKLVLIVQVSLSLLLLIITFFLVSKFNINSALATVSLILVSYLIGIPARKFLPDWATKQDEIGFLEFYQTYLVSDTITLRKSIEFDDIKRINLHHNYVKGESYSSKDIFHNGIATMDILLKNGINENFKFLIEDKKQLEEFIPVWKEVYKKGISVKEVMFHHEVKTILLKIDLSYSFDEFQELKKELGVNSFY